MEVASGNEDEGLKVAKVSRTVDIFVVRREGMAEEYRALPGVVVVANGLVAAGRTVSSRLLVGVVIKLPDVPSTWGADDAERWIVTVERAFCKSLAAVADSKTENMLLGSVTVLMKVVVALEIVKFEISVALNSVPFRTRLEAALPVTLRTWTVGVCRDVDPSWKAMASQPVYCNAPVKISLSLMTVVSLI